MAKQRIEKTLVVFTEEEVRRILEMAWRNNEREIHHFILKEFVKKVKYILRRRCSGKVSNHVPRFHRPHQASALPGVSGGSNPTKTLPS